MSAAVRMLSEAVEELASAVEHYRSIQHGLGDRFEQAFWRAVDKVGEQPFTAPLVAAGVRRARIRRFPWGIVYAIRDEQVLIAAVMHLHRQPGYWRERLKEN